MATLADRLAAPTTSQRGPRCSVGRFIATLDPADADAFRDAVERIRADRATGEQRHTVVWLVRAVDDPRLNKQALNRHVNRDCLCP